MPAHFEKPVWTQPSSQIFQVPLSCLTLNGDLWGPRTFRDLVFCRSVPRPSRRRHWGQHDMMALSRADHKLSRTDTKIKTWEQTDTKSIMTSDINSGQMKWRSLTLFHFCSDILRVWDWRWSKHSEKLISFGRVEENPLLENKSSFACKLTAFRSKRCPELEQISFETNLVSKTRRNPLLDRRCPLFCTETGTNLSQQSSQVWETASDGKEISLGGLLNDI